MSKFSHTDPKELPPEVDILFMGRRRVTRKFVLGSNNSVGDAIYKAYGDADPAEITTATTGFANLRLVQQKVLPSVNPLVPSTLIQVFETLTDELSMEVSDNIDYDLNGLKRTTRQLIGSNAADYSDFVVGIQTFGTTPIQYLANVKIDANEAFTRVNAIYLQAGVLSKRRNPGSIIGTVENTWLTWHVDPTDAAAMTAAGAGAALIGAVIADSTENVQGFNVLQTTVLSGTIEGVKTSYADVQEVTTPGTVSLVTDTVTVGGASGTIAVINHVPPRQKLVNTTVQVEITATPPSTTTQIAFNLQSISCAVHSTGGTYQNRGSDTFTNGNVSITGAKSSLSIGASIQTFPACFISGSTSATGTVIYTGAYEPSPPDLSGSSIVVTPLSNVTKTYLSGSGATAAGAAEGYYTSGILQRKARPVLTTLAGVTYWEVVTIFV